MSTNYYYTRKEDTLLMCKFSAGWKILVRAYPDIEIHNMTDWILTLRTGHGVIRDEYGTEMSPQDFYMKVNRWSSHWDFLKSHKDTISCYNESDISDSTTEEFS